MQLFVGKLAPDFTTKVVMPDNSIDPLFNLRHYVSGYKCVLFFYPLDFTFVCPSEIIAFNNRFGEFAQRNTRIVAVSIDSHFAHLMWKNTPYNKGGIGNVQFPMVADINKSVSRLYGVLDEVDGIAMRGTFIMDEHFILKHMLINDLPIGRNIDEAIRVLDAIEHHANYGEVCPAGWSQGSTAMHASSQGVADYLASNADKL